MFFNSVTNPDLLTAFHFDENELNILNSKDHIKDNFLPCAQPWASVHINNDGNVFPCLAVPIGNVREKSIKEIIFDAEFKKNIRF